MSDLPGHLEWHGPLALLAPGLWLLCGALAAAIIPPGRGRTVIAWLVLLVAALVVAACWRAAWIAGIGTGAADSVFAGWHRDYAAGWVHGGLPWLVAGGLAALVPLFSGRGWVLRLALAGMGWLLLVGLIWWAQLVAVALLISVLRLIPAPRLIASWLILLLLAGAAGAVAAYTAPAEPIDPTATAAP